MSHGHQVVKLLSGPELQGPWGHSWSSGLPCHPHLCIWISSVHIWMLGGTQRVCIACTCLDQPVNSRLAHNRSFSSLLLTHEVDKSGLLDFQRSLSLEIYILLITLCLPKVAKAEDQTANWSSIHHGDKQQPPSPHCYHQRAQVSLSAAGDKRTW